MKKYKVNYSGFVYVEASSESEAKTKYEDGDSRYEESWIDSIEEVSEFMVDMGEI